jgi:pimeloyl-ACP methyl ester carboxylesterase
MNRVRSGDTEIVYEVLGDGPPFVLLHPFPAHHGFWHPAIQALVPRYRVVFPDLRAHGDSEAGEGPATMEKHAADVARVCDDAGVGRAIFAGVSIGGYILFEFVRRYPERIAGLVLSCTRPQADTEEGRGGRLKTAEDVLERGTEWFVDLMIPKLLGKTLRESRPDRVREMREMMLKMSPQDIAQVQQGMAERPDSIPTLKTIAVPTLLLMGEEDPLAPPADGELMRHHIRNSRLMVIPRAGHYAVWEAPTEAGRILRQFVDDLR